MSLLPGARLGPYEVIAPIGAGGMGEVFKARDTRLDRSVAIKVLPAEFSNNAQLRVYVFALPEWKKVAQIAGVSPRTMPPPR